MTKIDFEKFILSLLNNEAVSTLDKRHIGFALEEQGLEYKDGEIVETQRRVSAEAKETLLEDGRSLSQMLMDFRNDVDAFFKDAEEFIKRQKNEQIQ